MEESIPVKTENMEAYVIDENKIVRTIVLGSDWQEVLTTIISEEGLDPMNIDIIKLADTFMVYLQKVEKFDFRVPARFILVAAILLRMKTELILEEEEKKQLRAQENIQPLNIEDIPVLTAPLIRMPVRKVTLEELIGALNKAFAFQERKETKDVRLRKAVEKLIGPEDDIELKIKNIYDKVVKTHDIQFSALVGDWKRKNIVNTFLPLLYLCMRSKILMNQNDVFEEIYIVLRDEKENDLEVKIDEKQEVK